MLEVTRPAFSYAADMNALVALFNGLSFGVVIGGIAMIVITGFGVFFWGSGLGWRDEPKKDPRNRL